MSDRDGIRPSELTRLTGREPLAGGTVLDFWRWALGDLRMNNLRGHLVEYLVARALDDPSPFRVEWGPWDVEAADGTLVEVKTTGRLQSWTTKRLSTPRWTFKSVQTASTWSDEVGDYVHVEPKDRVHVWVFALQTATEPNAYDPLDLDQWEFRVIPHRELLASGQTSAGVPFFDARNVRPVSYGELRQAAGAARRANESLG